MLHQHCCIYIERDLGASAGYERDLMDSKNSRDRIRDKGGKGKFANFS